MSAHEYGTIENGLLEEKEKSTIREEWEFGLFPKGKWDTRKRINGETLQRFESFGES